MIDNTQSDFGVFDLEDKITYWTETWKNKGWQDINMFKISAKLDIVAFGIWPHKTCAPIARNGSPGALTVYVSVPPRLIGFLKRFISDATLHKGNNNA